MDTTGLDTLATLDSMAKARTGEHADAARDARGTPEDGSVSSPIRRLSRFEADAFPVMASVSRSLAALVRALPNKVDGPRALQRELGIDYGLAWRTYQVATASDPSTAGADIPRARPMKRLLAAARRRRVQSSVLAQVERAYEAFEKVVERHAEAGGGDGSAAPGKSRSRSVFDALIGGVHGPAAKSVELTHRRAAFRANGYVWGIQETASLMTTIYHPSANGTSADSLVLSGHVGLHAVRKNMSYRLLSRSGRYTSDTAGKDGSDIVTGKGRMLLREFCTDPLPQVQTREGPDGLIETVCAFEEIGKNSAVDVFVTELTREMCIVCAEPWFGQTKGIAVPREFAQLDLLVFKGWTDPQTARASTHGEVSRFETVGPKVPEFAMPMAEQSQYLGNDLDALATKRVPRYLEMLRYVLGKVGWAESAFDIYRLGVPYPTMQTWLHQRVDTIKE